MGAVIRLKAMPRTCRECVFARNKTCSIRGTRIIAYDTRDCRMPLCPLVEEKSTDKKALEIT